MSQLTNSQPNLSRNGGIISVDVHPSTSQKTVNFPDFTHNTTSKINNKGQLVFPDIDIFPSLIYTPKACNILSNE